MWDLISGLLKDPVRLKAGLEEMIERERVGLRGDPNQEAKSWIERLTEVDQERRGYLRLAAKRVVWLTKSWTRPSLNSRTPVRRPRRNSAQYVPVGRS